MASLLIRSVSTVPGHTALTAMPAGPELGGHGLGQQDDAGLGRAVGAEEREGPLAGLAGDVADPTGARPAATIRVAQALETSQVPTTLTSRTRRNSAAGTSSSGPGPETRAAAAGDVGHQRDGAQLLAGPGHRPPRPRPRRTTSAAAVAARAAGRRARRPGPPGRRRSRCRGPGRRGRAGRCRGRRRPPRPGPSRTAVARPMPRGRAAPVTSATLPANGRSSAGRV